MRTRFRNFYMKSKNVFNIALLRLLIPAILIFIAAFYFGYAYRGEKFADYLNQFKPLRKGSTEFSLINPLVGVDSPNAFEVGLFLNTKNRLENLIKESKTEGLTTAGIYYRDLNSSAWFGLNEYEEFVPASLLKMSYALAAYKEGEEDTSFLGRGFTYTWDIAEETKRRNNAETDTELVVGQSYTARDLIQIMIIKSDNGARDMLQSVIGEKYLDEVFTYLGIHVPEAVNNFEMSTADYALFFRMLYSSTFINEVHSEELLSILTKTNFPYGITQYLPSKIATAHKWGVYNFPRSADGTEFQELHDCGIVYHPEKPYLVCVMTKGVNQEILSKFIAEVSRIIYEDTVEN